MILQIALFEPPMTEAMSVLALLIKKARFTFNLAKKKKKKEKKKIKKRKKIKKKKGCVSKEIHILVYVKT